MLRFTEFLLAENVHPSCLVFSSGLFSNELWIFALFLQEPGLSWVAGKRGEKYEGYITHCNYDLLAQE